MACNVCTMSTLPPRKSRGEKKMTPTPRAGARVWSFSFSSFEALAPTNSTPVRRQRLIRVSGYPANSPTIPP
jgi:hypothetical protein